MAKLRVPSFSSARYHVITRQIKTSQLSDNHSEFDNVIASASILWEGIRTKLGRPVEPGQRRSHLLAVTTHMVPE